MKTKAKIARSAVMMIVAVVVLAGCNESLDDLNRYVESVKNRPADPIPPIPSVKTYTPYEYEGLPGRDPFRLSITDDMNTAQAKNAGGPQPDFDRAREYLERHELDTLSMVGTFKKEDFFWTLIRDREGEVHRVAVGNYMGKNHGRVSSISDTDVSLSELVSDGAGGWLVREASIALGGG